MADAADIVIAGFQALASEQQDEAFDRLRQLRLQAAAGEEMSAARYLRSVARVAAVVGRTPTSKEYRVVARQLKDAGEDVEQFTRLYDYFGRQWDRVREAYELAETETVTAVMWRLRSRRLGEVGRYSDDVLAAALQAATDYWGHAPSRSEYEAWRADEVRKCEATGDRPPPSRGPFLTRWVSWASALDYFELKRPKTTPQRRNGGIAGAGRPRPVQLPASCAYAELDAGRQVQGLQPDEVKRFVNCYEAMAPRTRYVLTARLGVLGEPQTLSTIGAPLVVTGDRVRQLCTKAVDELSAVVGRHGRDGDALVKAALRQLALTS